MATITALDGTDASVLGLAASPGQDGRCVPRAFRQGINYFFFYGPGRTPFHDALAKLADRNRSRIIIATGSGSQQRTGLRNVQRKCRKMMGTDVLDVFFTEYVSAWNHPEKVFQPGGVLDELQDWKARGEIRYVGATTHDRALAKQLAEDPRVDVLMHRFNMAHRKAVQEVFPTAIRSRTPLIAFTATRWGSLLKGHEQWKERVPSAADCYRFCLAEPAVHLVLTAPRSLTELHANLSVLENGSMSRREQNRWKRYGDLIYGHGSDPFETKFP